MPRHLKHAALSLLPFLFFALFLLLVRPAWGGVPEEGPPLALAQQEPSTGALSVALEPVLSAQAGPVVEAPRPNAPGVEPIPEMSFSQWGAFMARALANKQWSLVVSLLLVGVVFLLRKAGARFWPWLETERGLAALALVGGTSTALAFALAGGQPFTLALLFACIGLAVGAAGAWSLLKSFITPRPRVAPVCLPEEVANGTCRTN